MGLVHPPLRQRTFVFYFIFYSLFIRTNGRQHTLDLLIHCNTTRSGLHYLPGGERPHDWLTRKTPSKWLISPDNPVRPQLGFPIAFSRVLYRGRGGRGEIIRYSRDVMTPKQKTKPSWTDESCNQQWNIAYYYWSSLQAFTGCRESHDARCNNRTVELWSSSIDPWIFIISISWGRGKTQHTNNQKQKEKKSTRLFVWLLFQKYDTQRMTEN